MSGMNCLKSTMVNNDFFTGFRLVARSMRPFIENQIVSLKNCYPDKGIGLENNNDLVEKWYMNNHSVSLIRCKRNRCDRNLDFKIEPRIVDPLLWESMEPRWAPGTPSPITQVMKKTRRFDGNALESPWSLTVSFVSRPHSVCHNRASHSRDTTWPRKLKVKSQGQRYLSQRSVQSTHFLSVSHQASYLLPPPSHHDNRASHSRDTIWPWKFKFKGQDPRCPSQRSIQLSHFLLFHINWTNHF